MTARSESPCFTVKSLNSESRPLILDLKAQTHKIKAKTTLSEEGLWPLDSRTAIDVDWAK